MGSRRRRFSDPEATEGADPYRLLADLHVSPESSFRAVLDASYGMTTPAQQAAINDLRLIDRRLAVDFFLYDLEVGDADEAQGPRAMPPLPVGWLESLAYPLPATEAHGAPAPAAPAPFLEAKGTDEDD